MAQEAAPFTTKNKLPN